MSIFLDHFPLIIRFLGSFSVLFLIIMINVLIFDLINNYKKNKNVKFNLNFYLLFFLLINFFIFNYTIFEDNSSQNGNSIKIAAIQGNIDQDWFERKENSESNLDIYLKLSQDAINNYYPQIIIWPEYVFTHLFELDMYKQDKIKDFSNKYNVTIILGSIKLENLSSTTSKRYNTLYIFQNDEIQTYNAYEPATIFDKEVIKEKQNYMIKYENIPLGLFLCYEEDFPYIFSKQLKEDDVELFFVIGNQYYIANYHGLLLSSLNSNLRTVENNRFMVRLETAGITTIIDNNGKNIKSLPINEEGILFYDVPLITKKTFYSIYRFQIEFTLFLISSLIVFFLFFNKKLKSIHL